MGFKLTVLGCSSATPTLYRHSSAQVLNVNERLFLIDCGEAAQMQMRKFRIKFQRIDHIFISHLHGDHYLGLMGFLFTLHLLGRTKEMHIYANPLLQEIVEMQLRASNTKMLFPIIYHPIDASREEIAFENEKLSIRTFPLEHRIPTVGFTFEEKKGERKLLKDMIARLDIPLNEFVNIKRGADFTDKRGEFHKNSEITSEPTMPVKYSYCSDTGYAESYLEYIRNSELLYHEATFMEEKLSSAREKFHCTCKDAARVAKMANVKKLMLGHYSARYNDLQPMLEEAKEVFENTILAEEGMEYNIIPVSES